MYFIIFYVIFLAIFFIVSWITIRRILFLSYPKDMSRVVIFIYVVFCLFVAVTTLLSLKNVDWSLNFDFLKNFKLF